MHLPPRQLDSSSLPGIRAAVPSHRKATSHGSGLKSPPTIYQVRVTTRYGEAYLLDKLFAEFEALHKAVRRLLPSAQARQLPPLPPRLAAPEAKRPELEAYLGTMLNLAGQPGLDACAAALALFLSPQASSSQPPTPQPQQQQPPQFELSAIPNASTSSVGSSVSSHQHQPRPVIQQQHAPVVSLSEVEPLPRSELDQLTSTIVDTVYRTGSNGSIVGNGGGGVGFVDWELA